MIKLLKIPPSFCVLDIGSNDDLRNIEGKQTPHSSEIDTEDELEMARQVIKTETSFMSITYLKVGYVHLSCNHYICYTNTVLLYSSSMRITFKPRPLWTSFLL